MGRYGEGVCKVKVKYPCHPCTLLKQSSHKRQLSWSSITCPCLIHAFSQSPLVFRVLGSGFGKDLLHSLIDEYQGCHCEASSNYIKQSFIYYLFLIRWSQQMPTMTSLMLIHTYKLSPDLLPLSSFLPVTSELPSLPSQSVMGWSVPGCSSWAAIKWSKGKEGRNGRHTLDEEETFIFFEISQPISPPN